MCGDLSTCRKNDGKNHAEGSQRTSAGGGKAAGGDGGVAGYKKRLHLYSNYFHKCHYGPFLLLGTGGERHREMVIAESHFSQRILLGPPRPLPSTVRLKRRALVRSAW